MPRRESELPFWISLAFHPKIGPMSFRSIRAAYPKIEDAWSAPGSELKKSGLPENIIANLVEARNRLDPEECLAILRRHDIGALTIEDPGYPKLLKEIPDAPMVLFLRGKLAHEDELALAVVGSRKYTSYGQRVTEALVPTLTANGLTIVSGLALGIDSIAHLAAIEGGGRTLAILGSGLDSVYPRSHARVAAKILETGGALLSEFPPGIPSYPSNFPIRNRIIAGISLGTLVVEAAIDSGSLLTAKSALDYNREVFAVPGEMFRETSQGVNNLLKMGAKVVTSVDDILLELAIPAKRAEHKARRVLPDTPEETSLLATLGQEPVHIDTIVKSSKMDVAKTGSLLTMMEMKGKVKNVGGNQYVKVGE